MTPNKEEDTINKSILLNWLYSADKNLSIAELGRWIKLRTNGKYILVKKEQGIYKEADSLSATENLNRLSCKILTS